MRVTVDLDDNSLFKMLCVAVKGTILCKKLPFKIRRTERGWHLIWKGLNISEEKSIEYRRKLGDDENRIKLDLECSKRIRQVLFTEKQVFYYGGIFPRWIGKEGREPIKICPLCQKEVIKSEKRWTMEEKKLVFYHKDGSTCFSKIGKKL
ncbi:MAG: hypothetical protein QXP52_02250 [Candidatus Aenigmatarchaeota archaeon]